MATITASATGGNWDDTAAWVGGVIPGAGDDVIIDATSGNITVSDNRNCLTINFSGYTGTFTINSGFTLSINGASITLGSGMTYDPSQTGVLVCVNNTATLTINFNGVTIPYLTLGRVQPGQLKTVTISGVNPTINNLVIANGSSNSAVAFAGVGFTIKNSLNTTLGGCWDAAITFDNSGGTVTIQGGASHAYTRNANTASYTIISGTTLEMLSNIYINGTSTTGGIIFQSGSFLTHNNFALLVGAATRFNTSVVEWFVISFIVNGQTHTLLSDLNTIDFQNSNNVTIAGTVTFNVNIRGSYLGTGSTGFNNRNVNFIGTGTIQTTAEIANAVININTSNPLGYTLGSVTRPTTLLNVCVLNLVGTSICTVFNTVSHTLQMSGACTINTNNTATGANIIGGSEIQYGNIFILSNQTQTFVYDTTILGNLTIQNNAVNGAKLLVSGNFTVQTLCIGTSTIELVGSNNANLTSGTLQNNLTINKSASATVSILSTFQWGLTGRVLQVLSGIVNPGTSTISTPNFSSVTINNMTFWNLSLGTGGVTVTQNALNTINGSLLCNGTTTFAGTHGFTTENFTCTAASSIITLQNINANPLAEYIVNGVLTLIGTAASRITLQSAGSVNFVGTANGTTLTRASGTAPSIGMVLSQATGIAPAGLLALFPARPAINGGLDPSFTINQTVTPTTGNIAMRAGFKAKFILENNGVATQNVAYTTTQDIDSSDGQTILAFGSNQDNISTNVSLFRTLNWGPLIAPSDSVAYTFVN